MPTDTYTEHILYICIKWNVVLPLMYIEENVFFTITGHTTALKFSGAT